LNWDVAVKPERFSVEQNKAIMMQAEFGTSDTELVGSAVVKVVSRGEDQQSHA